MKAKIVLKSFPNHLGIPGHQGGSLPMGADKGGGEGGQNTEPYAELDAAYNTIRDALKSGSYTEGWTQPNTIDIKVEHKFADGKVVVSATQLGFFAGKYAMGTKDQRRYEYKISVIQYRNQPDGTSKMRTFEKLYTKTLKVYNDPKQLLSMKKAFDKLVGTHYSTQS